MKEDHRSSGRSNIEERTDERIGNTPWIPVQELEQRVHELDSLKDRERSLSIAGQVMERYGQRRC